MEYYVICAASAVFVFILFSQLNPPTRPTKVKCCYETVAGIHRMLEPENTALEELLRSRAIPNAHLIHTFNIHSTFVSDDPKIHSTFVRKAGSVISDAKRGGWDSWRDLAIVSIRSYLPGKSMPFDTFIRSITFTIVAIGLLGADATSLEPADVAFVTTGINELWGLSKSPANGTIPPIRLTKINTHLARMFPSLKNPLELVIPAWETLWRLVAITFAIVYQDEQAHLTFEDFLDNPTVSQFNQHSPLRASAASYIAETLRLYPPTKHITRAFTTHPFLLSLAPSIALRAIQFFYTPAVRYVVADVETAQRSSEWGERTDVFDALRHHRKGAPPSSALLAFGYGRTRCIAHNWAPMAAGVIVAVLINQLDGPNYAIDRGQRIGGRTGWDGWVVRRTTRV